MSQVPTSSAAFNPTMNTQGYPRMQHFPHQQVNKTVFWSDYGVSFRLTVTRRKYNSSKIENFLYLKIYFINVNPSFS